MERTERNFLFRISATQWIFIGMAFGIALGHFWPEIAVHTKVFSNIFIRLIKSIIAPILFATLVVGIASTGSVKTMGRIGGKALLYFEVVTTIALLVGLAAANWVRPGDGAPQITSSKEKPDHAKQKSATEIVEHAFPTSIIDSMAKGEVLQIVVFAMLFGVACTALGPKAAPMLEWCDTLAHVMFKYTAYVMKMTPLGVGAAIAFTVATQGIGILLQLGKLVLTIYGSLLVFVVFVLGSVILLFRIPLGRFFAAVKEPCLIAFSTASSEAALPRALENMEKFGVPKHIVSFVLPTGYSFNLDGTTLYLAGAALFCAQLANIQLTWTQQILMMFSLMLTSKGVAGVPRASLVILSGTILSFGIPEGGIMTILAIDELLDMARTSVNVLGNCLATAVVARWEGVDLSKEPELVEAVEG